MIGLWKERPGSSIKREISVLKEQFRDIELKPCFGDSELMEKENDLSSLRKEIYSLEKKVNQFACPLLLQAVM